MTCPAQNGSIPQLARTLWEPEFGWKYHAGTLSNQSLDVPSLFQTFSVLDFAGQEIRYCPIWGDLCQDPLAIFASPPFLAICSSYDNITQQISHGRLDSNWTAAGFRTQNTGAIQTVDHLIPTCLISYCALVPECSSSSACLADSFYTATGALTGQGIASCWRKICQNFNPDVNPDIGGIGLTISYLMQTSIALIGFAVLSPDHIRRLYKLIVNLSPGGMPEHQLPSNFPMPLVGKFTIRHDRSHRSLWLRAISEFHIAQCYYSITLQIASCVVLFGDGNANKNQYDTAFLLMVGADGLVPVALTYYTLALLGEANHYHVALTVLSVWLACINGFRVIATFSSTETLSGGEWPAACGGLNPQGICAAVLHADKHPNPIPWFTAVAILCDILVLVITGWYLLAQVTDPRTFTQLRKLPYQHLCLFILMAVFLHVSAMVTLLFCVIVEAMFFVHIFSARSKKHIDDWSFGQVVGITIWTAIVVYLLRHELALLYRTRIRKGLRHNHEAVQDEPATRAEDGHSDRISSNSTHPDLSPGHRPPEEPRATDEARQTTRTPEEQYQDNQTRPQRSISV